MCRHAQIIRICPVEMFNFRGAGARNGLDVVQLVVRGCGGDRLRKRPRPGIGEAAARSENASIRIHVYRASHLARRDALAL